MWICKKKGPTCEVHLYLFLYWIDPSLQIDGVSLPGYVKFVETFVETFRFNKNKAQKKILRFHTKPQIFFWALFVTD